MREYKYDNLKFIMIFLVVFAHCLELIEGNFSNKIYILIYTFYMPIFVFISGYFAKCTKKHLIRYCSLYFIWQTIYYFFDRFVLGLNIKLQYTTPNWLLWYMLALIAWTLLLNLFNTKNKKRCIFFIGLTFALSIIAGFFDDIGYKFSLARIITFFPYFLLGYYVKNAEIDFIKMRKNGVLNKKIIIFIIVILVVTFLYFDSINNDIEKRGLYGSYSYNIAGYTYIFKLMWILVSLCELILFYNFIPNKKLNLISKIGANTLYIYLLHGLIIKILRYKINIFTYSELQNIILAIIITILILMTFGNILTKNNLKKLKDIKKC